MSHAWRGTRVEGENVALSSVSEGRADSLRDRAWLQPAHTEWLPLQPPLGNKPLSSPQRLKKRSSPAEAFI